MAKQNTNNCTNARGEVPNKRGCMFWRAIEADTGSTKRFLPNGARHSRGASYMPEQQQLMNNKTLGDAEDKRDTNIEAGIATGMPKIYVSHSGAIGDS